MINKKGWEKLIRNGEKRAANILKNNSMDVVKDWTDSYFYFTDPDGKLYLFDSEDDVLEFVSKFIDISMCRTADENDEQWRYRIQSHLIDIGKAGIAGAEAGHKLREEYDQKRK